MSEQRGQQGAIRATHVDQPPVPTPVKVTDDRMHACRWVRYREMNIYGLTWCSSGRVRACRHLRSRQIWTTEAAVQVSDSRGACRHKLGQSDSGH